MTSVELPDSLAEQISAFRQQRGPNWAEALENLLLEADLMEWDEEIRKPGPKASRLSEEEAERLAVQVVREARRDQMS